MTLIAIDEHWLCNRMSEITGSVFRFRAHGGPVYFPRDPELASTFEREVQEMLRQLIAEPAIIECPVSRASVQHHAVELLVQILSRYGAPEQYSPAPRTRAYVVDRALQYIESAIAEDVSIPGICTAIRVRPRTLCYSFESVLGVSPIRYILATRLNRVHRDLRHLPSHIRINDLAARWGFWHMGRFAQYYRETFGERPSETVRADAGPSSAHPCSAMTRGPPAAPRGGRDRPAL